MDVEGQLSRMEQLLAEARPVPLSASVMVNRKDFDDLIAEIREGMPEELRQARWIIKERDDVLAQAEREAEQIIADARHERDRLVSETEVAREAGREAERILDESRSQARTLQREAEDYIDSKLANFELVLQKTLGAVEKGRDRLRGRLASDELADPDEPIAPDPEDQPPASTEGRGKQFYDHESTS